MNENDFYYVSSECVELLLLHGANVAIYDDVMNNTSLHYAGEKNLLALT